MPIFQHKADRHLTVMLETGVHHSVYLVEVTKSIIPFTRFLRRFILQRLGRTVDYHLFWFATSKGYVVSISSDITVRHIIEEFYNRAVTRNYISAATKLYIGSSAKTLTTTVRQTAEQYTPTTSKDHQHTHGGSAITITGVKQ
ncbi:hypothetical protein [Pseudomonas lini]